MELKDLPDSELLFMEFAFKQLILKKAIQPQHVFSDYKWSIVGGFRSNPTEQEITDTIGKLHWLVDWKFATVKIAEYPTDTIYSLAKFDDHHQTLIWHREQAIKKHKEGIELTEKQKRNERLTRISTKISSGAAIASIVAILFGGYQWYKSNGARTELEELKARVERLESSVGKILLDGSLSTTIPSSPLLDSSSQHKDTISKIQDTVKTK